MPAMSAEVETALSELGSTLRASDKMPKLRMLSVLEDLGLDDDKAALEEEMLDAVAASLEHAQGAAGDSVKYTYAVAQMEKRWRLFIALFKYGEETEPSHKMVQDFCAFMYRFRQNGSRIGRAGLGDAVAKMAQYTMPVRAMANGASVVLAPWGSVWLYEPWRALRAYRPTKCSTRGHLSVSLA